MKDAGVRWGVKLFLHHVSGATEARAWESLHKEGPGRPRGPERPLHGAAKVMPNGQCRCQDDRDARAIRRLPRKAVYRE